MDLLIFCINIYERPDRYQFMVDQFNKYNLKVIFIRNHKHKLGGRYGCFSSHIQCIKETLNRSAKYCLILEDDACFYGDPKDKINTALNFIKNNDIDILYSCNRACLYLEERLAPNFYLGKSFGGTCYFLTRPFMLKILNTYSTYLESNLWCNDIYMAKIANKSVIMTDYISYSYPLSSDNDAWANNFFVHILQYLTRYTSHFEILIQFIIVLFYKLLIRYNLKTLKRLSIKLIRKFINIILNLPVFE